MPEHNFVSPGEHTPSPEQPDHAPHEHDAVHVFVFFPQFPQDADSELPGEHSPAAGAVHAPQVHCAVHVCVPLPQPPEHGFDSLGAHAPSPEHDDHALQLQSLPHLRDFVPQLPHFWLSDSPVLHSPVVFPEHDPHAHSCVQV